MERVEREYFHGYLVVGVHIRGYSETGTDQGRGVPQLGLDWPVVPLHPGSTYDEMSSWADASPIELFEEFLRRWLGGGPNMHTLLRDGLDHVRIFLASNSKTAKDRLSRAFGSRVIMQSTVVASRGDGTLNTSTSNSGPRGKVRRALVDWLLLARSAVIAGSYCSSFSHEASYMHLRERIQVRKQSAPFCSTYRRPRTCNYL